MNEPLTWQWLLPRTCLSLVGAVSLLSAIWLTEGFDNPFRDPGLVGRSLLVWAFVFASLPFAGRIGYCYPLLWFVLYPLLVYAVFRQEFGRCCLWSLFSLGLPVLAYVVIAFASNLIFAFLST